MDGRTDGQSVCKMITRQLYGRLHSDRGGQRLARVRKGEKGWERYLDG